MLAAGTSVADPSLWTQFGPFGICFVLLGGAILWLLKDRAKILGDLTAERAAKDLLHDKLLDQSERLIPIAEHLGSVTEAAVRVVTVMQSDLDRRP